MNLLAVAPSVRDEALAPASDLASDNAAGVVTVKRLIWLYFWLLILEGALRKWVLPGLSNPLLLIRDPVVILIYIFAGIAGVFPKNGWVTWIIGLALVTFVGSELGGRGNLLVSFFGLRTNFLHFPLIFLLPNVFTSRDMEKMGRWFLISTIPMAVLVLAQFRASPDAWLNNGAGGSINGQLESGFGKIRPPGTFSFTAGLVSYLSIAAAFAMQSQMQKGVVNIKLATAALPALAIMVGVSGSRSALGSVTLILASVAFICLKKPAFFGRGMKLVLAMGLAYFALGFWGEFQQGIEVHQSRIEGGGGIKDGLIMRALGDLLEPFTAMMDAPFLGMGLGMGTNAASGFLYGQVSFNLGEGEWGRVVRESGPILGFAYIGFRIALLAHLARRAIDSLNRDHPLPILLFAACFTEVLNGQLGVPMLLGFAVFGGGLCLAANNSAQETGVLPAATVLSDPLAIRNVRGRSVYAEQLHGDIEDPDISRYGP